VILCLHGAKHGWERLKWVFDIAGILRRHPDFDWAALHRLARAYGCRKMIALGLNLAAGVMQTKSASPFSGAAPAALREQWSMPEVPTLAVRSMQVQTRDTWWERWRVVDPFQPTARDREVLPLPRALHWMYYAIRPIRLLADYGRKL
jgi:hypothetical protein